MHRLFSATATLDQSSWDNLDHLVDQVESRWRQGLPSDFSQLKLPESGTLRERALVELIKVDQDYRSRTGQPRRLEEYLRDWPELAANSSLVAELLAAECAIQVAAGTIPTRNELQARFPDLGELVDLPLTEIHAARTSAERSGRPAAGNELVGQTLGRYELRDLLAQGGMGTVCRAFDRQLGREVALKVPRADLVDDPVVVERFLREARAAAGIRHPHVCPIYDVGQIEGKYFLSMALVEGESLANLLQRGPLPVDRAVDIARKLAGALAKVHQAGVVHRDIKPANVMIDESGEPLLMDFGLARLAECLPGDRPHAEAVGHEQTGEGSHLSGRSLLGTPAYMSPEQVQDEPQPVDARTDLYSLGVVLYQSLTGELPYAGATPEVLRQIAESDAPSPRQVCPELDPELAVIVARAMARRPEDRYQTASKLAAVLDAWLVTQRRHGFGSLVGFLRLRRRIGVALLILVALISAVWMRGALPQWPSERPADNNTVDKLASHNDPPSSDNATPANAPLTAEQAAAAQEAWARHLAVDVEITNSIGLTLRLIPPGSFLMGSTAEELETLLQTAPDWNKRNIQTEGPARFVEIDQAFYLGTCEVTVGQFRAFVTESNSPTWAERPGNAGRVYDRETQRLVRRPGFLWNDKFVSATENHPVVMVHREDAEDFCKWLSRKEGGHYELPTEEQWEFACRAGSVTPWFWGSEESLMRRFAWYRDPENASQPMEVRRRAANPFGLYDMLGNVSEMVLSPTDSIVLRGGNAGNPPMQLRSAAREIPDHDDPTHRNGFRVVRRVRGSTLMSRTPPAP